MTKKLKGKEWYTIVAPSMFGEKIIGETPAGDPETLKNRVVSVSFLNLSNEATKYYLKFSFRVKEIREKRLLTEFYGLQCLRDYISRMIRHGIIKIDNNHIITTKDNVKLRVKTITLISKKAKKVVEISLRNFVKETLEKEISNIGIDEFVKKVLDDHFKKLIMENGSKIYPIYNFEIRKVERLLS